MAEVVTFGEIMLRLSPNGYYRFLQNDQLQATFGGAEANVAVALAGFGVDCSYVTKLPKHEIGEAAVSALRYFGVDTSHVTRGGERIGVYYLEKGASQRASLCIYDRAHSAIAEAVPSDFDWDAIFDGAKWFYFTGITPALAPGLIGICRDACLAAKKHGMKIACDLNYREKLWTREEARAAMTELCPFVDVCITNDGQAKDIFGIGTERRSADGEPDFDANLNAARKLTEMFGFEKIAMTLRRSLSASDNDCAGLLWDGENCCCSRIHHVHIVDRVGGGDAFSAGLLYAFLRGKDPRQTIEFAVAADVLKHSVEGDFCRVSAAEVEKLAAGDGSGRIQR